MTTNSSAVLGKALILMASTLQLHAAEGEGTRPLKVFVLAGQSNMVGKRSQAGELPAKLRREQSNALCFTGTDWVNVRPGATEKQGFGPEISFCERVVRDSGDPVGIIKVSVGGTSLALDWSPQRPGGLYHRLRKLTEKARNTRPLQVVGMVWMQGGRDAKNEDHAKAYRENLLGFIKRARQDFRSPETVFVCGRSAAPLRKFPHITHVRKAQEGIDLPGYAWVDCDSIPMGADGVHYSTEGQVRAGYLFADAVIKLLGRASE